MKLELSVLVVLVFCLSVLPAVAQGTTCSTYTIRGNWGFTCDGSITPAPGAPLAQMKLLGTCTIDAGGNSTCEATASLAGQILTQGVKGQSLVNENCTGTIKYTQTINGQPAPDLNIRFFILDAGKQMRGFSLDPGTVLACKLYRIGI